MRDVNSVKAEPTDTTIGSGALDGITPLPDYAKFAQSLRRQCDYQDPVSPQALTFSSGATNGQVLDAARAITTLLRERDEAVARKDADRELLICWQARAEAAEREKAVLVEGLAGLDALLSQSFDGPDAAGLREKWREPWRKARAALAQETK